ncbi:phage integrase N-terminal SAM-like domain-containing protein [Lyngbya confervoides]|uniref:Phage integrase N-terminal SAM-like domain-containing protein n=1 Tax=Lyngbya confervoides BDU141951 TaxID=1574623 RepID=A0ABD4T5E2_9CYAN|nr:phage integrase N-terminal SAM-like domain-containing protein [Lyngbya confervoides]MCM1983638.1 phage integrase N-terminal SAM-like domain-containing protein [Lyngbya confervoides BDU141951]
MAEPPKLFDRIHETFRLKHLSLKTEKSYLYYIKDFLRFHHMRPPRDMGVDEIREYLSHLAVNKRVAASTQNIALNALLFLYKQVLCLDLPYIDNIERAKQPDRLPVVFTQDEVRRILAQLDGLPHLVSSLLCGSGMGLGEWIHLRINCQRSLPARSDGSDIRTVQELLDHKVTKTTMIDTHGFNQGGQGDRSLATGCLRLTLNPSPKEKGKLATRERTQLPTWP